MSTQLIGFHLPRTRKTHERNVCHTPREDAQDTRAQRLPHAERCRSTTRRPAVVPKIVA